MNHCQLYACRGRPAAVLELGPGQRLEVCARHAHAARERGYQVLVPDGEED